MRLLHANALILCHCNDINLISHVECALRVVPVSDYFVPVLFEINALEPEGHTLFTPQLLVMRDIAASGSLELFGSGRLKKTLSMIGALLLRRAYVGEPRYYDVVHAR